MSELTLWSAVVSKHVTEKVGFEWNLEYVWILVRGKMLAEFSKSPSFEHRNGDRSEAGVFERQLEDRFSQRRGQVLERNGR